MVTGGIGTEGLGAIKRTKRPILSSLVKSMHPIEKLGHTGTKEFFRDFVPCYALSTEYSPSIPCKISHQSNSAASLLWLGWN